jgi:competence protein ComEC
VSVLLIETLALDQGAHWQPVRGLARAHVGGEVRGWNLGDGIEILGRLGTPPGPSNPGERDHRQALADQGIFALVSAKSPAAVTGWSAGADHWSWRVGLARVRAAARAALAAHLQGRELGVAQALLLGDQSALDGPQFEGFQRTGVYHVLAISGQHLVLLAAGLVTVLRFTDWSARKQVLMVMALVIGYALLTGGRPPVLRATIMVVSFGLATLWLRRAYPLNSLALAWLLIFVMNPAEIFQTGTQLSFLAVLVLQQLVGPVVALGSQRDALDRLARAAQPPWRQVAGGVGRWVAHRYLETLLVWLALVPLLANQFHLFSPVAVLLGPPLVVLIGLALLGGFLLMPLALLGSLATPLGWFVGSLLRLAGGIVAWGEALPGGWWYVPGPDQRQVVTFYLIVVTVLVLGWTMRYWRLIGLLLGGWLWWVLGVPSAGPVDLRVTVLAVGHGNAAVVLTPGLWPVRKWPRG